MSVRSKIEQDIHVLDGSGQHRLQKVLNTAEQSITRNALLGDQNRALLQQNDEKERRKEARRMKVGNAKVMSYEDIVEAQRRAMQRKQTKQVEVDEPRNVKTQ